jgi:biopolymer transport protein TolR
MSFGSLERTGPAQPMSEINMTPLIDVMLVLLVIFMISAPLMASSLRLELPRSDAATPSRAASVLELSLDAQGITRLGDAVLTLEALALRAKDLARQQPATEVHLRADARVPYGKVAEVMGTVQQAGLTRVGFIVEPQAAR